MSYALKKPKEFLYSHDEYKVPEKKLLVIDKLIRRRLNGEPIAYITGKKEFFGLEFEINKSVLIPRPETELLVEEVIKKVLALRKANKRQKITIFDVGTGSGNIIISIAKNVSPTLKQSINFFGLDISLTALKIAKSNAKKYKVADRINFIKSDLFAYFLKRKKFRGNLVIVANLPYVSSAIYKKNKKNLQFEPKQAILSKKNGLEHYLRLFRQVKQICIAYYTSSVMCYVEISPEQKAQFYRAIRKYFRDAKTIFLKDLTGKTRLAIIRIKG